MTRCYADATPLYPLGGCTALDYGLLAAESGVGLSLKMLDRVVDYPVRDMTITVEAGITMASLAEKLSTGGQRLPVDVPSGDRATLGGVIATNTSGPRRFGLGTIRDYVIGISAVDGRGVAFKGGGRVVKNVAGYDFCKLLTGSMGTLGVITQVTLKVRPIPQDVAFVVCPLDGWDQTRRLLGHLAVTKTTPLAVEILHGPSWREDAALAVVEPAAMGRLAVAFEGTAVEVAWLAERLESEWRELGVGSLARVEPQAVSGLWSRLTEFPARDEASLVIQCGCLPSKTVALIESLVNVDPKVDIQSHAGNGMVIARFSATPDDPSFAKRLLERIRPTARDHRANVVVLSSDATRDLTRESVWGPENPSWALMRSVKRQFDPKNILNRGRFIY